MRVESDGHSNGNPRLYELIENSPQVNETGKSPTVWAWPQLIDHLKVAGQPVPGPWPPHQERRPDPDYESGPVAIPDSASPGGDPLEPPARPLPGKTGPEAGYGVLVQGTNRPGPERKTSRADEGGVG